MHNVTQGYSINVWNVQKYAIENLSKELKVTSTELNAIKFLNITIYIWHWHNIPSY